ncbi:MAG: NUDIX hydrolase [Woeseiaceae bacterium]|nr:NUDIX hydrolase [Woeseiaceae bacterium]
MGWKKLGSKTVFENPWMEVRVDRVINPGGGENEYGWIHFRNRAVAIVPLDEEGNTWLVGQQRYTLAEYHWELPMGGAPLDEAPLEAAKRELREETGLTAGDWQELMTLHTSNSITDEVGKVYVARDLTEGETEFEQTEDLTIRKLPFREALKLVMNGEITDAISVASILRVAAVYGTLTGSAEGA